MEKTIPSGEANTARSARGWSKNLQIPVNVSRGPTFSIPSED